MSNPIIHSCDHYVVLEPGKKEVILDKQGTLDWLNTWLNRLENLPEDIRNHASINEAAQRLLDTACNLEIQPGITIQWFAVRVDP